MTDETGNLILERLRQVLARISAVETTALAIRRDLTAFETSLRALETSLRADTQALHAKIDFLRKDMHSAGEADAAQWADIDSTQNRMDDIVRRLAILEAQKAP